VRIKLIKDSATGKVLTGKQFSETKLTAVDECVDCTVQWTQQRGFLWVIYVALMEFTSARTNIARHNSHDDWISLAGNICT
jgi:hypothetical protein